MVDVSARLKAMKKHWKGAREEAGSSDFDNLPEGSYYLWVEGELKESAAGNFGLSWCYTVARGEHAGRKQFSWQGLEDPDPLVADTARLYEDTKWDAEKYGSFHSLFGP